MRIQIPLKLQPLLRPKRYKVFFGGRGGAKTVSFSKVLLFMAREKPLKILGVREFMASIKESVHSSLAREVSVLNMTDHFDVQDRQIKGVNGSILFYTGIARNPGALQSYDNVDILWNEEAQYTSEHSLEIIIPTIIRKKSAELWFSFNPEDDFGAVYSLFVKPHLEEINARGFYEDDELYVGKINLDDNPFATEGILKHSAAMKASDYKKWLYIYGGECYSNYDDSLIQPEWFDAAIDAHVQLGFKPLGAKSLGFDLADTGDDKALILSQGALVSKAKRWGSGDLSDGIDTAYSRAVEWGAHRMIYDDDGLGKAMKVYLTNSSDDIRLIVHPYNGNASVDNPKEIYNPDDPQQLQKTNKEFFVNKRAQKYWEIRDRFEATYNAVKKGIYTKPEKLISLASDIEDLDVLKSELIKIKRVKGNSFKVQIQSKKEALKDGNKSPNMADALVMSFSGESNKVIDISTPVFESEFE